MATKTEKLKWSIWKKRTVLLTSYGIKTGRIHSYEKELIENLRHVYYGGIPASILLLCEEVCNGFCYDRGVLVTLGFSDDDFRVVDADIDGIKLNPKYIDKNRENQDPHYASHCFAERTKSDGTTWVYDTSMGLVIEKDLYYKMENPQITKINSKQETLNFCEYQDIKNSNINKDKYVLPLILPNIEYIASISSGIYHEELRQEIDLFKEKLDYDGICTEIQEDMIAKGFTSANKPGQTSLVKHLH